MKTEETESIVLANLQLRAKHNRKCPVLKQGGNVTVFKKKPKMSKQSVFKVGPTNMDRGRHQRRERQRLVYA